MPVAVPALNPALLAKLVENARGFSAVWPLALVLLLCLAGERFAPAGSKRPGGRGLNLAVWLISVPIGAVTAGSVGALATLTVNAAGGGWFLLPTHGWGFAFGCLVYFVAMDLGEYLFHRAQHAIPALWTMHSLHHSDPAFNLTTTQRHFWLEPLIKTLTVWLAVGLAFKASPAIASVYATIKLYNLWEHTDVKVDYGPLGWLLASPLYHRTHHSSAPEHFDCNFASILPIFDVLTGAYVPPDRNRTIETGLDTGEHPRTVIEATLWPWRGILRRSNKAVSTVRTTA